MPVRKIPINSRVITGRHAFKRLRCSIAFESPLERDFLVLADFDRDVSAVEEQPVAIPWQDQSGRHYTYTPDFLVTFCPGKDQVPAHQPGKRRPWLVEVKPHQELKENWNQYDRRFHAAVRYARAQGWLFHIWTDRRIRTPRLENARWLLRYMMVDYDQPRCEALLQTLEDCGELTVAELVAAVCRDSINQAMLIPSIWSLIGWRNIGADLNQPLGMRSTLWLPDYMPSVARPPRKDL